MDTPRITPQIPGLVGQSPSPDFRPITPASEASGPVGRLPSKEITSLVRSYSRHGRDGKKTSVRSHTRKR